jgi:hypothetical protein
VTISENILVEESLRAAPDGFSVEILLNWYRSLPLSCVETNELTLDGTLIPREQMGFRLNGSTRPLDELGDMTEEMWFIQDHAELTVRRTPALRAGDRVTLALRLGSRIPYILTGPTTAFENVSSLSRQMTVR